jgi:hypothetical protein
MKPESALIATMRRVADEHMRAIDSGADLAEKYIRGVLGDRAGDLLQVLSPEARPAVAREAFRCLSEDAATPKDVILWLSIKVRDMRWRGEDADEAAARIRTERQSGGQKGSAAKRDRWQKWRDWICEDQKVSHPWEAPPGFKRSIRNVILFRASASILEPALNERVPDDLPTIYGQGQKAPSIDSVRKNLFGRSK